MTEFPTTVERMSAAVVSDNLAASERTCDLDVLTGMGIAGSRCEAGHALLRYDLTQDRRELPVAVNATMALVAEIARRKRWPMYTVKRRQIAHAVVLQYVLPACPRCDGTGSQDADMSKPESYNPKVCSVCHGSGKRQLPKKNQREIREVLYVLQGRMDTIVGIVKKLMRP